MIVLGIETTCDETAVAIVRDGSEILSNVLRSQIEEHKPFGGVYPEIASRAHVEHLIPLIEKALIEASLSKDEIDLIAVSYAPGLIGSIVIGLNCAKSLSLALNIPFVGINHVEAHLYAAMMSSQKAPAFPSLGLALSGGHTLLVKINAIGSYTHLGTTVDDAIGECFDKVARFMDLPYPGGPEIEKLALSGDPSKYPFKAGQVKGRPLDFSFSGLKTNVLYTLKGQNTDKSGASILEEEEKKHVAASFQYAAFKDVVKKTLLAAQLHSCKEIYFGGGVTQSNALKKLFIETSPSNMVFHFPQKNLCLDNAAMIAGLGYHQFLAKGASSLTLEALPRTSF